MMPATSVSLSLSLFRDTLHACVYYEPPELCVCINLSHQSNLLHVQIITDRDIQMIGEDVESSELLWFVLWVVGRHIVKEHHQKEESNAHDVGKDGQLHVSYHPLRARGEGETLV